jgi:hypothetical protein
MWLGGQDFMKVSLIKREIRKYDASHSMQSSLSDAEPAKPALAQSRAHAPRNAYSELNLYVAGPFRFWPNPNVALRPKKKPKLKSKLDLVIYRLLTRQTANQGGRAATAKGVDYDRPWPV